MVLLLPCRQLAGSPTVADRLCWNVPVVNFDMRLVLPTVDCPKMMILYEAATWLL